MIKGAIDMINWKMSREEYQRLLNDRVDVVIGHWKIQPDTLSCLSQYPDLRAVGFHCCDGFDDSALIHLQELKELERFELIGNDAFTGLGLQYLSKKLNLLILGYSKIFEKNYKYFSNFENFCYLIINHSSLSEDFLHCISNSRKLTHLDLGFNNIHNKYGNVIGNFQCLDYLDLESNQISDEFIQSIGVINSLQYLILRNNKLSSEGIKAIVNNFPNLKLLRIDMNLIPDDSMIELGQLSQLTSLYITATGIGDRGIKLLSQSPVANSLCLLEMFECPITHKTVDCVLNNFPNVELLYTSINEDFTTPQEHTFIRNNGKELYFVVKDWEVTKDYLMELSNPSPPEDFIPNLLDLY
jgi:hypothetical protein